MSEKPLLTLFNAYIQSILRYGIQFWGSTTLTHRLLLQQKRFLRIIFKRSRRDSCKPLFIEHNILTITGLFILESCCQTHKSIGVTYELNSCLHQHNTRQKADIHVPHHHQYLYTPIKIFNKLPKELRLLPYKTFRKKLSIILTKHSFYDLREYFNTNILYP